MGQQLQQEQWQANLAALQVRRIRSSSGCRV
jgi:hypothetical protein